MFIYRNSEGVHGQRKFGGPWLSQTCVYIQRCCEPVYITLFSENLNFSRAQNFCSGLVTM